MISTLKRLNRVSPLLLGTDRLYVVLYGVVKTMVSVFTYTTCWYEEHIGEDKLAKV